MTKTKKLPKYSEIFRKAMINRCRDYLEKSMQDKELAEKENEKIKIRKLAKTNLFYLGKEILGYDKFGPTQQRWNTWCNEHMDPAGLVPSMNLVLQPRETYKTTFFTITKTIQLLINNPNLSILIINEVHDNAKNILKEIKGHFEFNKKFRDLFGDYVSQDDWSKEYITINRKTKNLMNKSIVVAGINSALTSIHPDVIILNDIAGKKDKESDAGRKQTFSIFQDSWDLLKKDIGTMIIEGTRKHVNDIYTHIINNIHPHLLKAGLQGFNIMITAAHKGGDPECGVLNFPDILTEEKLKKLRIVKEGEDGTDYATFMSEYELTPLDPKTQIFKNLHFINHQGLMFDKLSQWTDPAVTDTKKACYSAVIVCGRISTEGEYKGRWIVLYASIDKRSPTQTGKDHNRIYWMHSDWHPDAPYKVFMEDNGFQVLMKDKTIKESLKVEGKVPVPTKGKTNTENKDTRIQWLEPHITTGMLLFRSDYQEAPENYRLLIEQLRQYPQGAKDGPDALHGSYKHGSKAISYVMTIKPEESKNDDKKS